MFRNYFPCGNAEKTCFGMYQKKDTQTPPFRFHRSVIRKSGTHNLRPRYAQKLSLCFNTLKCQGVTPLVVIFHYILLFKNMLANTYKYIRIYIVYAPFSCNLCTKSLPETQRQTMINNNTK